MYWDLEEVIPWHGYSFPQSAIYLGLHPKLLRTAKRAPGLRRLARSRERQRFVARLGDLPADVDRPIVSDHLHPTDMRRWLLANAFRIFPNSKSEARHLQERFGVVSEERVQVVMNGLEPFAAGDESRGSDEAAEIGRDAFVCAGGIGPRKNQLKLVKAFRRLREERLLIIGDVAPFCEPYYRAARAAAGSNVQFISRMPQSKLRTVLRVARACVQPSFIETPGLVALDAAAEGTPVVVGDVGPVREYFGDLAHYCRPGSVSSIVTACEAAAAAGRTDGSAFAKRYEWSAVLLPLAEVYRQLANDLA